MLELKIPGVSEFVLNDWQNRDIVVVAEDGDMRYVFERLSRINGRMSVEDKRPIYRSSISRHLEMAEERVKQVQTSRF